MIKGKRGVFVAVGVAIFTIFLLLFQYVYIGIILKKQAEKDSEQLAIHTAKEIASSVEVYFRDGLSITNSYASNFLIFKQNKLPRQTIHQLMRGTLEINKNFLAVWTMWEPNAYDDDDKAFTQNPDYDPQGHFALAFYYQGNEIKYEVNDTLDFIEDFYTTPKKYKKPVILDPFYYQYHGNEKVFFETSLISPIVENDRFLGVIGVDIDMYDLQDKYSKIRVYDKGFVSLLSNSGVIVTHSSPQYIEKNIAAYTKNDTIDVISNLLKGTEFITQTYSEFSNTLVNRYYYPINLNYMAAPWYVMVEIPQDEIYEQTNSLKKISFIFLICFIGLLMYLFINIIDRRRNEKNLIQTLKSLEDSESKIKDAYHQLSLSEKKLEAIFNQTHTFIGLLDATGHLVRVNKAALDFVNKTEADLLGLPFSETPWWTNVVDERAKLVIAMDDAIKGQESTFDTHHIALDDSMVEVIFTIKPIFNDFGLIVFLLVEGVDVTAIKNVERELKKHQLHLEELVASRVNEIKELNATLISSNEELNAVNEHLSEQKEELAATLEQLTKAQEQLVLSGKMASLGLFTAGIAHEINNPINFISAATQALFEQLDNLKNSPIAESEELQKFFKTSEFLKSSITTGVDRTTEIILSLRNYSSSNSDLFVSYSMVKCIKDSLVILHNKYKNRIQIVERYNEVPDIECMPGKINQLFVNILANSIDAIADKGTIEITANVVNDEVEIVVSDDGHGISPENLKRMYDPFFTTKSVGKGIGLGMYIVYTIVEKHNAQINVQSTVGKGTSISLKFPISQLGQRIIG